MIIYSTDEEALKYFINNEKSVGHESIILGIRGLNITESEMYCINNPSNVLITDRSFNFSYDYELRIYTSRYYYIDSNNNWQSNGLLVCYITYAIKSNLFFFFLGWIINNS